MEGGGSTEASATCQADRLWSAPVPVCVSQMPLTFTTNSSPLGVNCSSHSTADDVREVVVQWLSSHGGARAQTECYVAGNFTWSGSLSPAQVQTGDQLCSGDSTMAVSFTVSDPCLASNTTTALLTIHGFPTTTTTTITTTTTQTTTTVTTVTAASTHGETDELGAGSSSSLSSTVAVVVGVVAGVLVLLLVLALLLLRLKRRRALPALPSNLDTGTFAVYGGMHKNPAFVGATDDPAPKNEGDKGNEAGPAHRVEARSYEAPVRSRGMPGRRDPTPKNEGGKGNEAGPAHRVEARSYEAPVRSRGMPGRRDPTPKNEGGKGNEAGPAHRVEARSYEVPVRSRGMPGRRVLMSRVAPQPQPQPQQPQPQSQPQSQPHRVHDPHTLHLWNQTHYDVES